METLVIRFLDRPRPSVTVDGRTSALSLRHAEILLLLSLHPSGLTVAQLTFHLYGDDGKDVSTRAEMCRLRRVLGAHLAARPYRLCGAVETDVEWMERSAAAGDVVAVLGAYAGELLPESEVPRVRQARDELQGAIEGAVLSAGLDDLWDWLISESGREHVAALRAFLRRSAVGDRRRPIAVARLRALQWMSDAVAT